MTKTFALLLTSLLFLSGCGPAQYKEMAFETYTADFGTIAYKSDASKKFTFTNKGDQPLVITKCKADCGCTVPNCPKDTIAPGEQGIVKVQYSTYNEGTFNKKIHIESNVGKTTLTIKGEVLPNPDKKEEEETPEEKVES